MSRLRAWDCFDDFALPVGKLSTAFTFIKTMTKFRATQDAQIAIAEGVRWCALASALVRSRFHTLKLGYL
jgi:hypothetical protein